MSSSSLTQMTINNIEEALKVQKLEIILNLLENETVKEPEHIDELLGLQVQNLTPNLLAINNGEDAFKKLLKFIKKSPNKDHILTRPEVLAAAVKNPSILSLIFDTINLKDRDSIFTGNDFASTRNELLSLLMIAAQNNSNSVEKIIAVAPNDIKQIMLTQKSREGWNALMYAARFNPDAIEPILKACSPSIQNEILLETSDYRQNALTIATTWNPDALKPILKACRDSGIIDQVLARKMYYSYVYRRERRTEYSNILTLAVQHNKKAILPILNEVKNSPQRGYIILSGGNYERSLLSLVSNKYGQSSQEYKEIKFLTQWSRFEQELKKSLVGLENLYKNLQKKTNIAEDIKGSLENLHSNLKSSYKKYEDSKRTKEDLFKLKTGLGEEINLAFSNSAIRENTMQEPSLKQYLAYAACVLIPFIGWAAIAFYEKKQQAELKPTIILKHLVKDQYNKLNRLINEAPIKDSLADSLGEVTDKDLHNDLKETSENTTPSAPPPEDISEDDEESYHDAEEALPIPDTLANKNAFFTQTKDTGTQTDYSEQPSLSLGNTHS